jgi:hypothetical protein
MASVVYLTFFRKQRCHCQGGPIRGPARAINCLAAGRTGFHHPVGLTDLLGGRL